NGRRTPFEVLYDLCVKGRVEDLELWQEHQKAAKETSPLSWSRSCRTPWPIERNPPKRYPPTDDEDEEVKVDGRWSTGPAVLMVVLQAWVYRSLWRQKMDLELLHCVEELGGELVQEYVDIYCHSYAVDGFALDIGTADTFARRLMDALRSLRIRPPP
ncbi:MAG: hypothetical protein AAFQ01_03205, partial [Bacteroidota bacterium]